MRGLRPYVRIAIKGGSRRMKLRKGARLAVLTIALLTLIAVLCGCVSVSEAPQDSSGSASSSASASNSSGGTQNGAAGSTTASSSSTQTEEAQLYTPAYHLNGKEIAVIKTSKGTIKVKFFDKDAPIASANFIELSLKGFYNGIRFHRYLARYIIQGGDPNTKSVSAAEVAAADASQSGAFGTGGPGYSIKDEYATNPHLHVDGSIAMARTDNPNSGGSQFYFALAPLPQLDHRYTVFGQATEGLDVIHNLRAGDEIISVTIENASK
jgi:peptidyl-prolyl cis-trans isomerase B (cyclophilin B)